MKTLFHWNILKIPNEKRLLFFFFDCSGSQRINFIHIRNFLWIFYPHRKFLWRFYPQSEIFMVCYAQIEILVEDRKKYIHKRKKRCSEMKKKCSHQEKIIKKWKKSWSFWDKSNLMYQGLSCFFFCLIYDNP